MRYFTRGWATGDLDDTEELRLSDAYARRLDAIEPKLSDAARQLARNVNLHDAIIESVRWRSAVRELTLALATVDTASRYHTVVLNYVGALVGSRHIETLREVARDREAQILYDEIDLNEADGLLVHRILFWPRDELTIEFRELRMEVTPRDDRRVNLSGAFIAEDETAGDGGEGVVRPPSGSSA